MKLLAVFPRLLVLQASWNHDVMQGVGVGFASLPLLRTLAGNDPERYHRAVARAGGFFNANPNLAGVAVAALARAECTGASESQIERLRVALAGPLGAIGDQLFWAGLVPGAMAVGILGVGLGWGGGAVLGAVVIYNAIRVASGIWGLRLGWRYGLGVGSALAASSLGQWAARVGAGAALLGGAALPLAAHGVLGSGAGRWSLALVLGMVGLAIVVRSAWWRISPSMLTVVVVLVVTLWRWGTV